MDASRSELSSALEQLDLAACLSMGFGGVDLVVCQNVLTLASDLAHPPEQAAETLQHRRGVQRFDRLHARFRIVHEPLKNNGIAQHAV